MEAAKPKFALLGREIFLRSHVNHDPGTHNFEKDNRQQLYRMLGDVFHPKEADYDWKEIPSEKEVKTYDELIVPLPKNNLNFNKIALQLAEDLPREPFPGKKIPSSAWSGILRKTVHFTDYNVQVNTVSEDKLEEVLSLRRLFRFGKEWSVPATEFIPKNPTGAVLLMGDAGRSKLAKQVHKALSEGKRVLAIDPFYFGESKIRTRDFLFAILVAAVGERPIGIQASQVAAAAGWLKEKAGVPVEIRSHGPRSSLFALIATALDKRAIKSLDAHGSLKSLKDILKNNWGANKYPEFFCFRLLEYFDVPLLVDLAQPRSITFLP